jgi:protein-tyrosine phosphatase
VTVFETEICYPKELKHLQITLEDSDLEDLSKYYEQAIEFIDENIKSGNVLVHCLAGVSRSSTIVIAYLMKTLKWDFEKSYKNVVKLRPQTNPNSGFRRQLKSFESKLKN